MHVRETSSAPSLRARLIVLSGISTALLGFAAVVVPALAVPAMTLGIVTFLAQAPGAARGPRTARWMLLAAAPFMIVGLVRFVIEEAMPGIVEGGHRALVTRAIAKLRVLRFSEDVAREQAYWDPDGDGVGSALLLEEMLGATLIRGKEQAPQGLLGPIGVPTDTPVGRALVSDGYAIVLYLPGRDGRGVARAGVPIDEERAERRWVAYAWPVQDGAGERPVIFLDEHERVLLLANEAPGPRYFGLEQPPPAGAALTGPTLDADAAVNGRGQDGGIWKRWKDKQPRETLPGDH